MWAAFKSDLQEFASGAADETTAVASKVGVTIPSSSDGGDAGFDYGPSTTPSSGQRGGGGGGGMDGSVLFANAAFSMGEKG
eukprot:CAMPEP_0202011348 /NCGR_PEP_ID=MMETSP0905-20130828/19556_1 /ASSEMBLY_ACC=CAM_ASM_000554 /TAXON_ID=420261 /ORGANISM="Thalassiosira antarctica, Strain CCMP982" /LENGTH=80 /DNA_ID=CAMNT_0048570193 /DNA_START=12 /DNA_END=251 /DNA_ORIENTATION=-